MIILTSHCPKRCSFRRTPRLIYDSTLRRETAGCNATLWEESPQENRDHRRGLHRQAGVPRRTSQAFGVATDGPRFYSNCHVPPLPGNRLQSHPLIHRHVFVPTTADAPAANFSALSQMVLADPTPQSNQHYSNTNNEAGSKEKNGARLWNRRKVKKKWVALSADRARPRRVGLADAR